MGGVRWPSARLSSATRYTDSRQLSVSRVPYAHGSRPVRLTHNPVHDVNRSWSPDGRYLSFTHDPPQNADIYIISADGLLLLPLTDHPAVDFGASWTR